MVVSCVLLCLAAQLTTVSLDYAEYQDGLSSDDFN